MVKLRIPAKMRRLAYYVKNDSVVNDPFWAPVRPIIELMLNFKGVRPDGKFVGAASATFRDKDGELILEITLV